MVLVRATVQFVDRLRGLRALDLGSPEQGDFAGSEMVWKELLTEATEEGEMADNSDSSILPILGNLGHAMQPQVVPTTTRILSRLVPVLCSVRAELPGKDDLWWLVSMPRIDPRYRLRFDSRPLLPDAARRCFRANVKKQNPFSAMH